MASLSRNLQLAIWCTRVKSLGRPPDGLIDGLISFVILTFIEVKVQNLTFNDQLEQNPIPMRISFQVKRIARLCERANALCLVLHAFVTITGGCRPITVYLLVRCQMRAKKYTHAVHVFRARIRRETRSNLKTSITIGHERTQAMYVTSFRRSRINNFYATQDSQFCA